MENYSDEIFENFLVKGTSQSNVASSSHASNEDKDKKIAEERSVAAQKLQRKQRLEAMVAKRNTNLNYLKKIHQGGHFWLNVALFSQTDIKRYVSTVVPKQRVDSFFYLGLSISKLLELPTNIQIYRAFSQCMEEWEYYHSGGTMQSVKFVMAKNSPCIYPQTIPLDGYGELARPSVHKFNNVVVFEYLQIPHISFELDYVEVLMGLCDSLCELYDRFLSEECYTHQIIYDTINRLDLRIKHHVVNMIGKELTELSNQKLKAATVNLRAKSGVAHSFKKLFAKKAL